MLGSTSHVEQATFPNCSTYLFKPDAVIADGPPNSTSCYQALKQIRVLMCLEILKIDKDLL